MTLLLLTAQGTLALGDAPATDLACLFCGEAAQLVASTAGSTLACCAECTADAVSVAAHMTGLRGAG